MVPLKGFGLAVFVLPSMSGCVIGGIAAGIDTAFSKYEYDMPDALQQKIFLADVRQCEGQVGPLDKTTAIPGNLDSCMETAGFTNPPHG